MSRRGNLSACPRRYFLPGSIGISRPIGSAGCGSKTSGRNADPGSDGIESYRRGARISLRMPFSAALADPRALRYEPAAAGLPAAGAAVSAYYSGRVTSGTHPAHRQHQRSLRLSSSNCWPIPGDEVLVPALRIPCSNISPRSIPSRDQSNTPWVYNSAGLIDFDALATRSSPRTSAMVLVNPNNPTGSFLKQRRTRPVARRSAASTIWRIILG